MKYLIKFNLQIKRRPIYTSFNKLVPTTSLFVPIIETNRNQSNPYVKPLFRFYQQTPTNFLIIILLVSPPMQSHQFVLSYWNMRGTTQALRYLLQYLELDYQDNLISWPKDVQYSFKFMFEYPKMPNIKHNGFEITQIVPMGKYICRYSSQPNLLGKNFVDEVLIDVFINKIFKARKVYFEIMGSLESSDDVIFQKLMLEKIKGIESTFLKQIAEVLQEKEWYMGYLTLADFFLYNFLFYIQGFIPSLVLEGSSLDEYMKRFEAIEQIDKYWKSGRCNHVPTLSAEINTKWIGKRDYK